MGPRTAPLAASLGPNKLGARGLRPTYRIRQSGSMGHFEPTALGPMYWIRQTGSMKLDDLAPGKKSQRFGSHGASKPLRA